MAQAYNQPDITSVQNNRVKEWAGLLDRKGRQKAGAFLIEGIHLVEEAVRAGAPVRTLVYEADKGLPGTLADHAEAAGIETVSVTRPIMERCTDTETPQGIFAVVDKPAEPAETLLADPGSDLVVVVDGVQDPGNLGTIIRSADAVGASAVVLGRGTVDLYTPKRSARRWDRCFICRSWRRICRSFCRPRAKRAGRSSSRAYRRIRAAMRSI